MSVKYSTGERALLVELYFKFYSYKKASSAFSDMRPDSRRPTKSAISRIVAKFRKTGSLLDKKRTGRRKSATGSANVAGVVVAKALTPAATASEIASYAGISKKSVNKILKDHKCHQRKFARKLKERNIFLRSAFVEELMEMVHCDDSLLNRICFTDETTFFLNGSMKHQNSWYWTSCNSSTDSESTSENSLKLTVWAAIYNNSIIGPFFIANGADEEGNYLNMLENEAGPALDNVAEDDEVWWYQDGPLSRLSSNVQESLNETFPDRWIGKGGPIALPPASPDLSPMGYFFWGYIQHRVFQTRLTTVKDLRSRINRACKEISLPLFEKSRIAFYNRLAYCATNYGGYYEHLL